MNRRSLLQLLGLAPLAATGGLIRASRGAGLAAGEVPALGGWPLTAGQVRTLKEASIIGIDGGGLDDVVGVTVYDPRAVDAAEAAADAEEAASVADPSPSLCDVCTNPGHCCRHFGMSLWETTIEGAEALFKDRDYPFQVLAIDGPWTDEESGREYGRFSCSCPKNEAGRCTIYEDRPALCREYEPASDRLCVFHRSWWFADQLPAEQKP